MTADMTQIERQILENQMAIMRALFLTIPQSPGVMNTLTARAINENLINTGKLLAGGEP